MRAYEHFLYAVVAIGLVIERSCMLSSRSETYSEVRRLLQLKTKCFNEGAKNGVIIVAEDRANKLLKK